MRYFFEVWLRGFAKDYMKEISNINPENYHPHITIVRPFEMLTCEEDIQNKVVDFCKNFKPIPFTIKGRDNFDDVYYYVPVIEAEKLLDFDSKLERLLENDVAFDLKPGPFKNLHVTVSLGEDIPVCPRIEQYMLRITALRDKKIWFSYDFVTNKVLDREETLDDLMWDYTVGLFSQSHNKYPSEEGFVTLH